MRFKLPILFRDLPFEEKGCPGPTTVKLPVRQEREQSIKSSESFSTS
jgi:hypothetical protein